MQATPRGLRLHIGLFGRRNVGKSSLLNALVRQQVAIVSAVAGTTTDPVEKPMELLPLGPVVFIDTAGVDDEAEALNTPLLAYALNPGEDGPLGSTWSPVEITCDGSARVQVAACKKAEGDDRLILRLWESHGGRGTLTIKWNVPISSASAIDPLERPTELEGFTHTGQQTTLTLRPFQLLTIAASPT